MSRSHETRGVEFVILARPGRNQWTVAIYIREAVSPQRVSLKDREIGRLPLLVPSLIVS
jgi:hypothetical protein